MRILFLGFYVFFFTDVKAQVPVSKEPRHHIVFENAKARILNVLLTPGDTTQYHIHSTPSVFIGFTKTHTGWQRMNEAPVKSISAAGDIWFEDLNPPHTKIHRVWNEDTSVYHVMDIELLSKDTGFNQRPLTMKHTDLLLSNPWTRIYKIKLDKGDEFALDKQKSDFILVSLNDAEIVVNDDKKQNDLVTTGKFFWINTGERFSIINNSATSTGMTLVEIK